MWSATVLLLVASVFCVIQGADEDQEIPNPAVYISLTKKSNTPKNSRGKRTPELIKSGIEPANKQKLVEHFNNLRKSLGVRHLQTAYWDDDLAASAQKFAETCQKSTSDHDRWNDKYQQKPDQKKGYGGKKFMNFDNQWKNIESRLKKWEKKGNLKTDIAQMSLVGCGYAECEGDYDYYYFVCYYFFDKGRKGTRGEKCGQEFRKNRLCDCGAKYCANKGTLKLQTCQCECQQGWQGSDCTEPNCNARDRWFCKKEQCRGSNRYYCPRLCTGECTDKKN